MNFVPAVVVIAAISGINNSQPIDYKTAFNRAQQDDKPLVVLVTAEWCPPCKRMKQNTIPELLQRNKFQDVHFATVDLDKNARDARNLIGPRGVPQLVMFEKIDGQWSKRILSGYQDTEKVASFIEQSPAIRMARAQTQVVDQ